ncbi:MAG: PEP-CTERM sorting domain-containing protein [Thermoguttaceae bacterium]
MSCRFAMVGGILLAILVPAGVSFGQGINYQVLHSFNFSEAPTAGLVIAGSTIFGETMAGGMYHHGGFFKVSTSGSSYTVLHSFTGTNDDVYGDVSVLVGSTLYGTGSNGQGNVFKMSMDGTASSILHAFGSSLGDGTYPLCPLIANGSTLYGATQSGGALGNNGTIFKINADDGSYSLLHTFNGDDGTFPNEPILSGSTIYGTTLVGGSGGAGSVYKFNAVGDGFTTIYSFASGGIGRPTGSIAICGATIYGVTEFGVTGNYGAVFRVNTDGSDYRVIHLFSSSDVGGFTPLGLTILNSTLYGETQAGGANNSGSIFSMNMDGSGYSVLHPFSSGALPHGCLTIDGSTLYGTTYYGGSYNGGSVFSLIVPEPSTLFLLGISSIGLLAYARRRR